jgi:hypothetical protein
MIEEHPELHDPQLSRELHHAFASESTPASWIRGALLVSAQVDRRGERLPRREPLAVVIAPQLAGMTLILGFVVAVGIRRHSLTPLTVFSWIDHSWAGAIGVSPGLVAAALLPPLVGLVLAESVRGFPTLRRWLA